MEKSANVAQCVTRARKSCSQGILHTHVFERDEPLFDGFPGGPLAAGEDVAHARLVRLVLAHAAREAVAGDACNRGKGTSLHEKGKHALLGDRRQLFLFLRRIILPGPGTLSTDR